MENRRSRVGAEMGRKGSSARVVAETGREAGCEDGGRPSCMVQPLLVPVAETSLLPDASEWRDDAGLDG